MSDVMLHGVLNMPPELWREDHIDVMQRHSRYVQASKMIRELQDETERLREHLRDAGLQGRLDSRSRPSGYLRRLIQNLTDVYRQAEINRLVTRAARRCTRDLKHAVSHIPPNDPCKPMYEQRVGFWRETFWDCAAYRDGMHQEVYNLETKVAKLEEQIRSLGEEPEEELPF